MSATLKTTLVDHDGAIYTADMATINYTVLGVEDHGLLRFGLDVNLLGGGSVMLGWLEPSIKDIQAVIKVIAGEYGTWEQLSRQRFFALYDPDEPRRDFTYCKGFASLDGQRVFIFDMVRQA